MNKTWKRPRDDEKHRDFMEPPRDDHGHKLSPAFTYGRLHPAAYADQDYNTGRFDDSSEQALSWDLRQDGYGKRGRSDSPGAIEGATSRLAASTRYRWLLAMRRLGEECRGRRLSHGHKSDRQTTVAGVATRATVSALPIRGSGQGRREGGVQLGRVGGETLPPAT